MTPEQRQTIPKINNSNKTFTEDAINVINNNADYIPAYFQSAEPAKDLTLFEQMDEIGLVVRQLTEKIEDTRMLAGSEAYISALTVYRLVEAAANAGVPGADTAYAQLKERFTQASSPLEDTDTTPQTPR